MGTFLLNIDDYLIDIINRQAEKANITRTAYIKKIVLEDVMKDEVKTITKSIKNKVKDNDQC